MKLNLKNIHLLNSLNDISINHSDNLPIVINTINAHSYNVAKKDNYFGQVLLDSTYLLPDGQSIVWAKRLLTGKKIKRIAGADLFEWEMNRINKLSGKCFFLGSTDETLSKISEKVKLEYPYIKLKTFSPPYKNNFSEKDNSIMFEQINSFEPNVLFVGMTAPKQEKWVHENYQNLKTGHICSIGAVFDFYAGNINRAPLWMQNAGLEWLYRLLNEPHRMWKRYIIGNTKFIYYILKEKLSR